MQRALLDSSIYVSVLRYGNPEAEIERLAAETDLWLSSVVLEELYAGAKERDRGVLELWERDFELAGRILVPSLSDWIDTGKMLRLIANKYDYEKIGRGRLTNDALIAVSAARMGIRVLTLNEKDFRKLAEFRGCQYQVIAL
jgi:predicted nucleic acid-binding protein